ncbi:aldo/keto reductase [Micromonospora arborensis]|uniref:Aldo/keto reductase n=1 Tax=Micromonospora arborensis TaxID=2116518 RepID=A0A318NF03_9ACTN|nr:aldo/keto reductase [Micromonospora arborensis]PYC63459.1 aldo/keto reductase [Micromonospora arborensis]
MDYVRLGRTALRVSPMCLGTLNWGVRTTVDESYALMDAALEHGINFFDTANHYGWQVHRGLTEEIIGDWFAQGGGRREKVVLGSKVCNSMSDWPNDRGLSMRHIIAACEDSLRRLRTDYIDVYQMHHADPTASWEEVWQAMELLTQQGKIRYVGSSNFTGWSLVAGQEKARLRNHLGLVSEQCLYNLLSRQPELELIPAAQAYDTAVLACSPLHGGLLGGGLRKLADGTAVKTAQGRAMVAIETRRPEVEAYEDLCAGLGVDPAELAQAWLLQRPGVTGVVIGPRTMAHLDSAIHALKLEPDSATLTELDRLFPPPVSQIPQAW